jgi:hypothetical protein
LLLRTRDTFLGINWWSEDDYQEVGRNACNFDVADSAEDVDICSAGESGAIVKYNQKYLATLWLRNAIGWAILICLGLWLGKTAMAIALVIVAVTAGRMIDNFLSTLIITIYVQYPRILVAGVVTVWGLFLGLSWRLIALKLSTGAVITIVLWMALFYVSWIEVVSNEPNPVVRASVWTSVVYVLSTIIWYVIL